MKKTICSIAIMLMSVAGMSAFAQNEVTREAVNENEIAIVTEGASCADPACQKTADGKQGKQGKKGKKSQKGQTSCKQGKDCSKNQSSCKQGKQGKKDLSARQGKRQDLFAGIELSADQQAKLQALKADAKAKREKVRKEIAAKDSVARVKARQDFDKEVAKILTPEQLTKYQANQAEKQAKRQEMKKAKLDRKNGAVASDMKARKAKKGEFSAQKNGKRKSAGQAQRVSYSTQQ